MKKQILVISTIILSCLILCSCTKKQTEGSRKAETRIWVDDTGRVVELKANITRIAVSGRIAQSIVYPIAKDMLTGIAEPWSEFEKSIIPSEYLSLPVHGRIYGIKGKVNPETLIALSPDVVIDIGANMAESRSDMDAFTEKTGIPFIHITLDKTNLDEVFIKLGTLLNRSEQANQLADFTKKVYSFAESTMKTVTPKSVIYLTGSRGERVIAHNSYFSSALDLCTDNVAKFSHIERMSYAPFYTNEQLMLFNPEIVLISSICDKDEIKNNVAIQSLDAVQNSNVYFFPHIPYENMGFPPGPCEIFGILWLLNTLYGENITFDYQAETALFYQLFF